VSMIMALGRRDLFVFAWLFLAIAGLYPVILVWALIMGAANATAAVGQLLSRAAS
jgi:hypothetical protein